MTNNKERVTCVCYITLLLLFYILLNIILWSRRRFYTLLYIFSYHHHVRSNHHNHETCKGVGLCRALALAPVLADIMYVQTQHYDNH